MTILAEVGEVVSMGAGPLGERRQVAITGGRFEGEAPDGRRLAGSVLPGGCDWQIVRADGVIDLDARYALREETGAAIRVVSRGYRHGPPEVLARLARGEDVDPAEYFFRSSLRFETGDARLGWLNRTMGLATAVRRARQVELTVFRVL